MHLATGFIWFSVPTASDSIWKVNCIIVLIPIFNRHKRSTFVVNTLRHKLRGAKRKTWRAARIFRTQSHHDNGRVRVSDFSGLRWAWEGED